jgi:hypothetical protein
VEEPTKQQSITIELPLINKSGIKNILKQQQFRR